MSIKTLLLRLRGGSKGTKRIADLTPEELVVRRETEKINKRKQRARARQITLEKYQENLGHQQDPIIPERAQPAVRKAAVRAAESFKEAQKRKKGKIVEKQQKIARENAYEEYEGFPDIFSKAGVKRTARKRTQAKTYRLGKKLEKATRKLQEENIVEENRQQEYVEAELIKTAMKGGLKDYKIVNYTTKLTPEELLTVMQNEIKVVILANTPAKIIIKLHITFEKLGEDGEIIEETKFISSDPFGVNNSLSDLTTEWEHIVTSLVNKLAVFVLEKSGWSIKKIHGVHIQTSATMLQLGHSYVEIPKWLAEKKCVINIQNKDNKCFIYAVDRSLNPLEKGAHSERVDKTLKNCESKYNLTGITYPVKTDYFKIFEENNPDIALNVWYLDHDIPFNKTVQPLYPSVRTCKKEAVIFLYKEHFLTVTSESRLLSIPKKEKGGGDQHAHNFPCRRCCLFFRTQKKLETHKLMCVDHAVARTTFPKPGKNFLKFRNGRNVLEAPLVIYADGESIMKGLNKKMNGTVTQICQHNPSGFGFECVYNNGHHEYHEILGERSAKGFVNALYDVVHDYYHKTMKNIPLTGWELQKANLDLKTAKNCTICKHPLIRDPEHEGYTIHRPVKFSDGYTGKFLGTAHHDCEEMAKHTKKIPVLFHNLAGYDLKMFIRELGSANPTECGAIEVIAKTQEDVILLQKKVCVDNVEGYVKKKNVNEPGKFVWQKEFKDVNYILSFQDSLKHLSSSLENLASSLRPDQFKITRASVNNDEEKFRLICRKGVYPYNYMDSFERLNETELPPKSAFHNVLKNTDILDKEYEHAQNVWKTFGCKTMWEYHNLYLRTDVSLLADVFEAYRDLSMETFGLDPVHYPTAPSFFWDALLKSSGILIELISEENSEMYNFFERGIRGGLSMAIQRFSEANNKYMTNYDPTKESTFIINPDENALYASSESKPLPIGGFGWMTDDELLCWKTIDDKLTEQENPNISEYLQKALGKEGGRWGCTLEVDLHYPKHLHDLHNDLPLAPEPMVAGKGGQQKLIPNFNDKKNYVVYHETLKNYLKLGLKLKKVHRAVKYVEFPWMKDFVEMNAELRKKADLVHDKFKTEYYKLGPNSVYGKTMENVRNRMTTDVTQNPLETKYMCSKPTFRDRKILSENMALILRGKTEVKLNKPIFMGQVILDRSKNVMDNFVYEYLYPKWGAENVSLNYIDTDGVVCTIKTDDIFADIKDDDAWDTSNFPGPHNITNPKAKPFDLVTHPSGITVRNRKVPGKVKLESGARIITKVACICSKMYSFVTQLEPGDTGNGTVCKCKGGDRHKVNEFTFGNYERCLFENEVTRIDTNRIKSKDWNIFTENSSKVALRNSDDKRIIDPNDGFTTYARGHWRILEDVQLILSNKKMFPGPNKKNWPSLTLEILSKK